MHTKRCIGYQPREEPDAEKPHVRICEGQGRAISLAYSTWIYRLPMFRDFSILRTVIKAMEAVYAVMFLFSIVIIYINGSDPKITDDRKKKYQHADSEHNEDKAS